MKKQQTKYIDAFVLVIKKDNLAAYKKMAKGGNDSWMKHGALSYRECVGEDLNPAMGGPYLPFPKLTKLKPDELVIFSYIEFESKAHRNKVNKKVLKEMDEAMKDNPDAMKNMPFEMKKMAYGGFKVLVGS